MSNYTNMIGRFGIVTVMNIKVYANTATRVSGWASKTPEEVIADFELNDTPDCTLDSLKFSNLPAEGPTKTITGGQYANTLIKFGKSVRCEMQDALGGIDALQYLGGAEVDEGTSSISFTEYFPGPVTLIGDTFFINQKTGKKVSTKIIIYQFMPDALVSLVQDSEGDATVFDYNGDLQTVNILLNGEETGMFYSIVDPDKVAEEAPTIGATPTKVFVLEEETVKVSTTGITSVNNLDAAIAEGEYESNIITIEGKAAGKTKVQAIGATGSIYIDVTVVEALE